MNISNRIYGFSACCLMTAGQLLYGQRILNGNFEDNTAGTTLYNMQNEDWTGKMHDCYAFGKGNELDIQTTSSTWGQPVEGKWFVSLATPDGRPDGFTMRLSEPLLKGVEYELSWFERASDCCSNELDPLVIGVSNDSMSAGLTVLTSQPKKQERFIKVSMKFTAPVNAAYISVHNQGADRGWNFVDDFQLARPLSDVVISYSPVAGWYVVDCAAGIDEILVTGTDDGKEYFHERFSAVKRTAVDLHDVPEGEYYIFIYSGRKRLVEMISTY